MHTQPLRCVVRRVLSRLERAELHEPCPHLRDDYRIAWMTVLNAALGVPGAHVAASYAVLGLHPDRVWLAVTARRRALLGEHYEAFFGEALPPKKPVQKEISADSRKPALTQKQVR
jgi:hypothetical protein